MAGATISSLQDLLKNRYLPPIRDQLENKRPWSKRLRRDYESVSGLNVVMSLHTGRNEGIGARPDNGALPEAGHQTYKQMQFPVKYNYARIRVTGPLIAMSRNNAGAFARALTTEIQGAVRDLERDLEIQRLGKGNGQRAVCTTTAASTTVVIDSGI